MSDLPNSSIYKILFASFNFFGCGTTILTYLAASYYGITHQITRIDLNMVEMPAGTSIYFPEHADLRTMIDPNLIDYNQLFVHFLQHSFLPKLLLFTMIAVICTMIAERGRLSIFAQKAETVLLEPEKSIAPIA